MNKKEINASPNEFDWPMLPDSRSVYNDVDIEESMKSYTATSKRLSNIKI